jgi:hypothetical protein
MKVLNALVMLTLGCAALAGCSSLGVKPWQRDVLSRPDMKPDAPRANVR